MLIRFEVANFRSILDPVELSMVAVDQDRPEARLAANLGESLLPVAAVFGPNASGKSNVIAALTWMRAAVFESLRFWDDEIPIEPFAFADGKDRPSQFTIESVVSDVRFEYVVELDGQAIHYEALFHYPEKKRRRIFEREGDDLRLQRGLGALSGTRELLTSRTLALSIARRFDEPLVSGFARDLLATQTLGLRSRNKRSYQVAGTVRSTLRWFEELPDRDQLTLPGFEGLDSPSRADRTQALALLRLADLGIDDVLIDDHETVYSEGGPASRGRAQRRVRLVHRTANERAPLDFAAESEGTRTWFQLIGPVLAALRSGSLLLFDELDASLHPTLSTQLIRLFHDPATNPKGAQLIFTSHDTSLLNNLNRDEVWLTEKAEDGSTRLGALAEFAGERVRRSQNLERAYLHGRFGALPDVDRTELLRALGLIG
ncbi:ATP-binding protein [Sphaerisporangium sp. TRM90804]|uniref:AAA family ATPase n=1 Tax=Sphaerisporangium sp. TRM90804 TaxID=3031113 RepID=UPI00244D28B1|nr:ATP-binding protein [Sphaerisporangium sp. TRM90804]MDH2428591.1 AAA family ATPase [Sphaerisporangium sp. TRM90804]